MTSADCGTCGDPQTQHKGGKGGCRHCEFGCAEFAPDVAAEAAEKERVLTAVAEVCEDQAGQARTELGQRSASERLREVEQAHASLVEQIEGAEQQIAQLERERDSFARNEEKLAARRDELFDEGVGLKSELTEVRNELAKQHERATHFEGRAGDQLVATVKAQQEAKTLQARVDELEALLVHAEQYARDLQDNGDVADGLCALLDRATDAGAHALLTAGKIRGLFTELREQLAEQDRRDGLLTRREQLAAEIAAIDRELLGPQAADPAENDRTVRAWAVSAGLEVNPRGRIPDWVRDKYREAHA